MPAVSRPKPPQTDAKSQTGFGGFLLPLGFACICAALLTQTISLPLADLGRHLKNGDIILNGSAAERHGVLHTNFYSYVERDYRFINHHWLTGVVFYALWRAFSFEGLTLLYALLVAFAVFLFVDAGRRLSNSILTAAIAAIGLPLIGGRVDVRPEGFTYLFSAVTFYLLFARPRAAESAAIFAIPAMMLAWVNLHIGFVFGFLILAAFTLRELVPAILSTGVGGALQTQRRLIAAGLLTCIAALINPSFIRGAIYPFRIYRDYGYTVNESEPITKLAGNPAFEVQYALMKIFLLVLAVSFAFYWIFRLKKSPQRWAEILLLGTLLVMSLFANRHFVMLALVSIAIVPRLLADVLSGRNLDRAWMPRLAAGALAAYGLFQCFDHLNKRSATFGLGLQTASLATTDFLNSNQIAGPIFNDFNNGGYLVFERFSPGSTDRDRVFIDARSEAYPKSFFELYRNMQADEAIWHEQDAKYHFNVIAFSLMFNNHPETERFLIARAHDPDWAPVFADDYTLVFLRRNAQNAKVIAAHELPKSMFR